MNTPSSLPVLFFILACFLFTHVIYAEDLSEPVELYNPPLRTNSPELKYPTKMAKIGHEGWVDLSFMVDKKGAAFGVTVIDSSGEPSFERAALEHVRKTTYQPATANGKPVEAAKHRRFRFEMNRVAKGASTSFYAKYKRFNKALRQGSLSKAAQYLNELNSKKVSNLYEDAYLNLANFYFLASSKRDPHSQLDFLSKALNGNQQERYLKPAIYLSSLDAKFILEVQNNDLASALETYKRFSELEGGGSYHKRHAPSVESIKKFRDSDEPYAMKGTLGKGGLKSIKLFKQRFSVSNISGDLHEFRLHCSKRFVAFAAQIDSEYKIPDSYGKCSVTLRGSAGSEFTFWQA